MLRRFTGRIVATTLVLATGLGAAVAFAADEPANIIKYRKAFMSANGAHITMVAAVAKGEVSFTDEVAEHAHALAQQGKLLATNLNLLFPEGTGKGGADETAALPVIWEKWGDFEAAAKTFETEGAKLAEVAESGDVAAIGQQLGTFGKNACGGCHETFREKKN
ncbi:MAG TPA: cytochrome c [Geminicoccaceae bacterium]|nr:cytochrome c [Geminicoccaceae bacterium]